LVSLTVFRDAKSSVIGLQIGLRLEGTRARVDSSPTIAGGRVFVGSNDGRVYGLDLARGKKVWEYEAASPVTSSTAVGQVICFG